MLLRGPRALPFFWIINWILCPHFHENVLLTWEPSQNYRKGKWKWKAIIIISTSCLNEKLCLTLHEGQKSLLMLLLSFCPEASYQCILARKSYPWDRFVERIVHLSSGHSCISSSFAVLSVEKWFSTKPKRIERSCLGSSLTWGFTLNKESCFIQGINSMTYSRKKVVWVDESRPSRGMAVKPTKLACLRDLSHC